MTTSNYPNGFNNGVTIRNLPIVNTYSGKVVWVDSNSGLHEKGTFERPFLTLQGAIDSCPNGGTILIKEWHSEDIKTAGGITVNQSVTIIGLGSGVARPNFTFSTTVASIIITGDAVTLKNVTTQTTVNGVVNNILVTGAGNTIDIEHQDDTCSIESICCIKAKWSDNSDINNLSIRLKYNGCLLGTGCSHAIALTKVNNSDIYVDFYGKASVSVVEFVTAECTNINVNGIFRNGTTALTKNVVDTITGSKWTANGFDGVSGCNFSGGSDRSLTAEALNVATANTTTNTVLRDVVGNKADTAVQTGTTDTISLLAYSKGIAEGLYGTNGIVTYPESASPGNGVSMAEVLRSAWDKLDRGIGTLASFTSGAINYTSFTTGATTLATCTGSVYVDNIIVSSSNGNMASATDIVIVSSNAYGASVLLGDTVTLLNSERTIDLNNASVAKFRTVLENTSTLSYKSTGANATGTGTVKITVIYMRLTAGSTLT